MENRAFSLLRFELCNVLSSLLCGLNQTALHDIDEKYWANFMAFSLCRSTWEPLHTHKGCGVRQKLLSYVCTHTFIDPAAPAPHTDSEIMMKLFKYAIILRQLCVLENFSLTMHSAENSNYKRPLKVAR
jgi:hypothetical protein